MQDRIGWLVLAAVALGEVSSAAAAPQIAVAVDHGVDVPVGTSYRMLNSVSNFGDAALVVTRLEITGADAEHFQFANPAQPSCTGGAVCTEPFTVEPSAPTSKNWTVVALAVGSTVQVFDAEAP